MELLNNLLVGLVIGIIILIIEYRTKWFSGFRRNDEFDVGPEYRETPSPSQITAELKALPSTERENAKRNYEGLLVKWCVVYEIADTLDKTAITHIGCYDTTVILSRAGIICPVDVNQYPRMKTLKKGSKIWLAGKIEKVMPNDVILLAPGAILKI